LSLLLVGRDELLRAELARHPAARTLDIEVRHAASVVEMADSATAPLRSKPESSIRVAAEAVARGDAAALFSSGHTGAAVVATLAEFGMLAGIHRPALAATIPARTGSSVLLDSGATIDCRPHNLLEFAIMGSLFARVALDGVEPRVGLLSIGEEASKGNDLTRDAHALLRESRLNFIGHGRSDVQAIRSGIATTYQLASLDVVSRIADEIQAAPS
jgi:glycerol-3-phosphate acyltransferase PlsX